MIHLDTYIVRFSTEGWLICLREEELARFQDRPDAIRAAVAVAEASGRAGRTAEVLSEEDGHMHPIWEVGRDAYSSVSVRG